MGGGDSINHAFLDTLMNQCVQGKFEEHVVDACLSRHKDCVRYLPELTGLLHEGVLPLPILDDEELQAQQDRSACVLSEMFLHIMVTKEPYTARSSAVARHFCDMYKIYGRRLEEDQSLATECQCLATAHALAHFRQHGLRDAWMRGMTLAVYITNPYLFFSTFVPVRHRTHITKRVRAHGSLFRRNSLLASKYAFVLILLYHPPVCLTLDDDDDTPTSDGAHLGPVLLAPNLAVIQRTRELLQIMDDALQHLYALKDTDAHTTHTLLHNVKEDTTQTVHPRLTDIAILCAVQLRKPKFG